LVDSAGRRRYRELDLTLVISRNIAKELFKPHIGGVLTNRIVTAIIRKITPRLWEEWL
jgi:hypothetical protein